MKTSTRHIIRLDKLPFVVRLERRTTEDHLSRWIMRVVPVLTLETHNQTNNKCLPKFVQTHNTSSSIKTANMVNTFNALSIASFEKNCSSSDEGLRLETGRQLRLLFKVEI